MKDTKKHGVFWFFKTLLTFALVIYTCVRCCMIVSDKHHAAAAESVTLTPAQTVALYGTDISGTFRRYDDVSGTIDFHYAFPLKSVGNQMYGGGFGGTTLDSTVSYQQEIERLNGCVYVAQESDWGGGSFPTWRTVSSTQNPADCNFNLQLSVDLGSYTDITQNIAWSTGTWSYVNEYYDYGESFPYYYGCPWECYHDNGALQGTTLIGRGYAMRGGNPNYNWIASGLLTLYPWDGQTPVAENDQCTFAFSRIFMNDQTTGLTVNRMVFGMQTLQQVHKSAQFSPPTGDIWLIIFCPTITDHVPPVTTAVTTSPHPETTTETIPAATYPVATMPPDSTDVPLNVINQNLITNNYQLNLIIGQLNLIYNQMKLNGEINAKLAAALDADNDPGLQFPENTDIRQYMSDVFYQTGTEFVYSSEDLQSYTRAIPFLSSLLHGQTWFAPFAFLGTIGLIMIVFSYLVFRR